MDIKTKTVLSTWNKGKGILSIAHIGAETKTVVVTSGVGCAFGLCVGNYTCSCRRRQGSVQPYPVPPIQFFIKEESVQERHSVIAYLGGKYDQAPWIVSKFPRDYRKYAYTEPFCGSISVFLYKEASRVEVLNDRNKDVINFWDIVQSEGARLAQEADKLIYARDQYNNWADDWHKGQRPADPFEQALRFFYISRSSFAAKMCSKAGWAFSIRKNSASTYRSAVEEIYWVQERLKNVQLETKDFREVIKAADYPDTVIYCDPPYVGTEKYYTEEFGENDHRDLAGLLTSCEAKVLISYYEHEFVRELYPNKDGWIYNKRLTIRHSEGATGENRTGFKKEPVTEILITNFTEQLSLF